MSNLLCSGLSIDFKRYRLCGLLGIVSLVFFIVFALPGFAQQPFQDGNGDGTLFINGGGFTQINIADQSIHLGYLYDNTKHDWSFGFDVSGRLTGARAILFSNNATAPDFQTSFSIGKKFFFTKEFKPETVPVSGEFRRHLQDILRQKKILAENQTLPKPKTATNLAEYLQEVTESESLRGVDLGAIFSMDELKKFNPNYSRLVFQGGYSHKQYNLFDPSASFDKQLFKKDFHSPFAQLAYLLQVKGNVLFGAGVGIQRSNNSGDLTEVDVRDFNSEANGGITREVGRTKKALKGDFTQSTETFVNSDFVWFPKVYNSRIGVNFFTRSGLTGVDKGFRPGVGVFFSEKGAPTRIISGVSVSLVNGKASVALIAGYNF